MNSCECEVIEFSNDMIRQYMGRSWRLGPVIVMQDPSSDYIKVCFTSKQYKENQVAIKEFREAIGINSELPIQLRISVEGNRGPYGMGEIEFDDLVVCRMVETHFFSEMVEMSFEMIQKGKELRIFNGISDNEEQQGQKPLFWASILKGNIH